MYNPNMQAPAGQVPAAAGVGGGPNPAAVAAMLGAWSNPPTTAAAAQQTNPQLQSFPQQPTISVEMARSMLAAQSQTAQPNATNNAAFAAQAYMAQLFRLQAQAQGLAQAQAMQAGSRHPGNMPAHMINSVRAPLGPPSSPVLFPSSLCIHPATHFHRGPRSKITPYPR